MKKIAIVVAVAAAAVAALVLRSRRIEGGTEPAASAPARDETLARVGETEFRRSDVERFIAGLPASERQSAAEDREMVLDHLIQREQLLRAARADTAAEDPAKAGDDDTAIRDWIARRLQGLPAPTEADLRAFYEARKAELPPDITYEQVAPRIAAHLQEQQRGEAFDRLLAEVQARYPATRNAEAITRLQPAPATGDIPPPGEALGIPRLVSLGADACVPCKMMAPIREELKAELAGKLRVDFIDVWKDRRAARLYRIRAIPTLVFYAPDGREIGRREGFTPKDQILAVWREAGIVF